MIKEVGSIGLNLPAPISYFIVYGASFVVLKAFTTFGSTGPLKTGSYNYT
jgi:hypothetical protein